MNLYSFYLDPSALYFSFPECFRDKRRSNYEFILILPGPLCSLLFFCFAKRKVTKEKATFVESLRATKEALRCMDTASITFMALVLTLPGNSIVLAQAYLLSTFYHRHQS